MTACRHLDINNPTLSKKRKRKLNGDVQKHARAYETQTDAGNRQMARVNLGAGKTRDEARALCIRRIRRTPINFYYDARTGYASWT